MGVTRMLTVGLDGASCRSALAAAEAFPQVYAAIGRHPNNATGFDDADLAELRALAAHERCVAIGETGLDFYRDYAPRADQERAFAAQIALAKELGKPLVIHTRAADDDTLAQLAAEADGVSVVMHCFSMPDAPGGVPGPRLRDLVRRQRHLQKRRRPRRGRARGARRAAAGRDRRPLPDAAAGPQAPQPAGLRGAHRGLPGGAARGLARRAGRYVERTAARVFGW